MYDTYFVSLHVHHKYVSISMDKESQLHWLVSLDFVFSIEIHKPL